MTELTAALSGEARRTLAAELLEELTRSRASALRASVPASEALRLLREARYETEFAAEANLSAPYARGDSPALSDRGALLFSADAESGSATASHPYAPETGGAVSIGTDSPHRVSSAAEGAETLSRQIARDARRYDGGFETY